MCITQNVGSKQSPSRILPPCISSPHPSQHFHIPFSSLPTCHSGCTHAEVNQLPQVIVTLALFLFCSFLTPLARVHQKAPFKDGFSNSRWMDTACHFCCCGNQVDTPTGCLRALWVGVWEAIERFMDLLYRSKDLDSVYPAGGERLCRMFVCRYRIHNNKHKSRPTA